MSIKKSHGLSVTCPAVNFAPPKQFGSSQTAPGWWSSDPVKFSTCEENIAFTLTFPSGIIANCYSSYEADGVNRYRATGPDGWVQTDPAYSYPGLVQ
ncbi:MAG TPA: hypothetical protein VG028_17630 [Terriglobia bacterium]|nr:hypothetical protein [Terriglobia bacterium]